MNALTSIGRAGATEPLHDVHRLGDAGCWSYLHSQRLGRVFIMAGGRPHIFPVNYGVHERTIVFRTAAGAKLDFGPGSMSCFEIDGYDEHHYDARLYGERDAAGKRTAHDFVLGVFVEHDLAVYAPCFASRSLYGSGPKLQL